MILTVTISDEGTESLWTQPQLTQSFSSDSRRPTPRGAPGDLGQPGDPARSGCWPPKGPVSRMLKKGPSTG